MQRNGGAKIALLEFNLVCKPLFTGLMPHYTECGEGITCVASIQVHTTLCSLRKTMRGNMTGGLKQHGNMQPHA
jgi:hypothetical protein